MMRQIRMSGLMVGAALLALLTAAGCSTAVDGVDGASEGLSLVRKTDFANQLMYINLAASPAPMTAEAAEAAGGLEAAIPVVVRFYDDWAVAWYAPDGEALAGNPNNAIRMWHVEGNLHVLSGELSPDEEPGTTDPDAPAADPNLDLTPVQIDTSPDFQLPANRENELPFAFLDWMEDANLDWQLIAPGFHPGCA